MGIVEELARRVEKLEKKVNVTLDDLVGDTIEETTDPTANTKRAIPHELGREPSGIVLIYGNVYISDFDESVIDVRSVSTSEKFKIKLLR